MNRRAFLASLGVAAGAAAFHALPLPAPAATASIAATTGDLAVGDVITFAGRYAVDPVTRRCTTRLQHFTVTAIVGPTVTIAPERRQH